MVARPGSSISDRRTRTVGLTETTPLPNAAIEVAATVILLRHTAGITWSTDMPTLQRVLSYLRADLEEAS